MLGLVGVYKSKVIVALTCMALYGATDGAIPYLLKRVLDDVFNGDSKKGLEQVVVILLVFAVFRSLFGFLDKFLASSVGHLIVRDMRQAIVKKTLELSPADLIKVSGGEMMTRTTNDLQLVRSGIMDLTGGFLREGIRIFALLVTAIYLDRTLGLFVLLGFPICILPVLKFGKRVRKLSKKSQEDLGGMTSYFHEIYQGLPVIQGMTAEKKFLDKFVQSNDELLNLSLKSEKYSALTAPTNELVASLALCGVIVYGGISVMSGVRTQGEFIAFISAVFLLYEPIKRLGRMNSSVQIALTAATRYFEFLDQDPSIANGILSEPPTPAKRIEIKNVGFSYLNNSEYALQNINLEIKNGERIAFVGPSGSGKSTLVSMLFRFFDPTKGDIIFDGMPLKDYDLQQHRKRLALVPQDLKLFRGTIRENILIGKLDASEEEIQHACINSGVSNFLSKLPLGLETMLLEGGSGLSGGERARIAVARAFIRDAEVVILDEATANLDLESEEIIVNSIETLFKNKTVIAVAHRLAMIKDFDKIFVFERGELKESGTHQELMDLDGVYRRLWDVQL